MLNAMLDGNVDLFEERLQDFAENSFSYFDPAGKKPEKVYHSYILGLLVHLRGDYYVESGRENGYGRSDVMIMPKNGEKADVSVILEFKKAKKDAEDALKTAANAAIEQIKSKGYASEARKRGGTSIMCYGIGFAGKRLKIASLVM